MSGNSKREADLVCIFSVLVLFLNVVSECQYATKPILFHLNPESIIFMVELGSVGNLCFMVHY